MMSVGTLRDDAIRPDVVAIDIGDGTPGPASAARIGRLMRGNRLAIPG